MSPLETTVETLPNKNIEGQKKILCEAFCKYINSLDAEDFFNFSGFICNETINESKKYKNYLMIPEGLFTCDACKKTFGECDEYSEYEECIRRFKEYCNIEE